MSLLEDTVKLVRDHDAGRPRSLQAEPGWSEVGGCRSALGFRLSGAWASDETDLWGAIRGTAIHEYLGGVLTGQPGVRTEVTTSYRGIPGHADLVLIDDAGVWDFKTTRLANSRVWREKPSALRQKRIQAHGYAAGLIEAGELPGDCNVGLMVIPVDGRFSDWWLFEEKFDRALADEGADRLEWVRARLAAGGRLPKDEPYAFCESWCDFFSSCRMPAEALEPEPIEDPELAAAIAMFGEATAQASAAAKVKKDLDSLVRGLRGTTPDGWRVSLGNGGESGTALDEEWIRADYAARGEIVPEITTPGSRPRLTVTRVKAKAAKS
jgi:hypothetical protein